MSSDESDTMSEYQSQLSDKDSELPDVLAYRMRDKSTCETYPNENIRFAKALIELETFIKSRSSFQAGRCSRESQALYNSNNSRSLSNRPSGISLPSMDDSFALHLARAYDTQDSSDDDDSYYSNSRGTFHAETYQTCNELLGNVDDPAFSHRHIDSQLFNRGGPVIGESCDLCLDDDRGVMYQRLCCLKLACEECLDIYAADKVLNGVTQLPCPFCDKYMEREEVLARLSGDSKEKFYKFLVDNSGNDYRKTCPRCCVITEIPRDTRFGRKGYMHTCATCGLEWCFPCQAPFHYGIKCKEHQGDRLVKIWAAKLDQQKGQRNAQRCPKCKVFIQRSQGCDHMSCSKCDTEFCYLCGDKYRSIKGFGVTNRSHHSRYSIFGCKYIYNADFPLKRRAVRGSLFTARLLALPAVGAGLVGAGAVAIVLCAVGLPVLGARRLVKHYKKKRRQREYHNTVAAARARHDLFMAALEPRNATVDGCAKTAPAANSYRSSQQLHRSVENLMREKARFESLINRQRLKQSGELSLELDLPLRSQLSTGAKVVWRRSESLERPRFQMPSAEPIPSYTALLQDEAKDRIKPSSSRLVSSPQLLRQKQAIAARATFAPLLAPSASHTSSSLAGETNPGDAAPSGAVNSVASTSGKAPLRAILRSISTDDQPPDETHTRRRFAAQRSVDFEDEYVRIADAPPGTSLASDAGVKVSCEPRRARHRSADMDHRRHHCHHQNHHHHQHDHFHSSRCSNCCKQRRVSPIRDLASLAIGAVTGERASRSSGRWSPLRSLSASAAAGHSPSRVSPPMTFRRYCESERVVEGLLESYHQEVMARRVKRSLSAIEPRPSGSAKQFSSARAVVPPLPSTRRHHHHQPQHHHPRRYHSRGHPPVRTARSHTLCESGVGPLSQSPVGSHAVDPVDAIILDALNDEADRFDLLFPSSKQQCRFRDSLRKKDRPALRRLEAVSSSARRAKPRLTYPGGCGGIIVRGRSSPVLDSPPKLPQIKLSGLPLDNSGATDAPYAPKLDSFDTIELANSPSNSKEVRSSEDISEPKLLSFFEMIDNEEAEVVSENESTPENKPSRFLDRLRHRMRRRRGEDAAVTVAQAESGIEVESSTAEADNEANQKEVNQKEVNEDEMRSENVVRSRSFTAFDEHRHWHNLRQSKLREARSTFFNSVCCDSSKDGATAVTTALMSHPPGDSAVKDGAEKRDQNRTDAADNLVINEHIVEKEAQQGTAKPHKFDPQIIDQMNSDDDERDWVDGEELLADEVCAKLKGCDSEALVEVIDLMAESYESCRRMVNELTDKSVDLKQREPSHYRAIHAKIADEYLHIRLLRRRLIELAESARMGESNGTTFENPIYIPAIDFNDLCTGNSRKSSKAPVNDRPMTSSRPSVTCKSLAEGGRKWSVVLDGHYERQPSRESLGTCHWTEVYDYETFNI